jgi:uncharacterized protein YyaL (SSP411 family)
MLPAMNRLATESSPYLRQHAHNPVDWFPWGDEAFAKSRQEHKPIFLSIGYSTCHWCHVMERESFENADIAGILNAHFVPIKVDREERPDLDHVYMTATQTMTGRGGWPMSVWLTPDLKPFYCGTYFPPQNFATLLERIHEIWAGNRDQVVQQAHAIIAAIQPPPSARGELPDAAPLHAGFAQFREAFDAEHGGFGGAPKFPRPVVLNFLFRYAARAGRSSLSEADPDPRTGGAALGERRPTAIARHPAAEMALLTLRRMAGGGLFDHLGGGFHRYSVDDRWLVSHFEKMLYDQAQLVVSYVEAYQITRDPFCADIARRTCEYVLRDLTSPSGGFYSAEDADSEGIEGKFYVWTHAEIETVLGDRAEAFCRAYDVEESGNWEHGLNILHGSGFPVERAALLAARTKRVRPHRDEKIITAWNGLMISALAKAAQAGVGQASRLSAGKENRRDACSTDYLIAARRAGEFILTRHYRAGRLWRTPTVPAVLDDYAFLATGLLDLYETDFDPHWLTTATELTDVMRAKFHDAEAGGFFLTSGEDASVILRLKEEYDGAEPSGNSVAALALLRLAEFTDRQDYLDAASQTLAAFGEHLRRAPHAVPQMLCALDWALGEPKQVTLTGQPDVFLRVLRERFLPTLTVRHQPGVESTAQVCIRGACQLPVRHSEELKKALEPTPHAD